MALYTAQLHPGRAIGFFVIGASLHEILTRIKAEPHLFPKMELLFSHHRPLHEAVTIVLPHNGLRLRFDGSEQRLRLIEIVDFTKSHITFKDRDLLKPPSASSQTPSPSPSRESAPSFRHIYNRLLGPTYPGEFIPPAEDGQDGIYVLSYPGVAFNFALAKEAYSPEIDVVSQFAAMSSQLAKSMAVFSGDSWAVARPTLWTAALPSIKATSVVNRAKDVYTDEISLVRLYGGGTIDVLRKWTNNGFRIQLGETTPQQLVMELGPPNAIYYKNDQRMMVHKMHSKKSGRGQGVAADQSRTEDLTDTDQSSLHTGSEGSDAEDGADEDLTSNLSGECFFNYFYQGFDILLSSPQEPACSPPGTVSKSGTTGKAYKSYQSERLVASKLVLHGNIPGSYEFNRHRRCRWEIGTLDKGGEQGQGIINSETHFTQIEGDMKRQWASCFERHQSKVKGMALNRGWGDSPEDSCELVGGWEETRPKKTQSDGDLETTTTLYGFPGMVFEVLKNGYVNTLTVY
ncbi:hypothetical protein CDD81_6089 [Ophiocordyceps australis]|uniref:Uncharacterized protein n=1 Tax=Ophiocordyceps australis TaxID=1399860 RepID=A0A2C5Y1E7_9HYPO|nr:hypothetical protein CDD81_6089 [Ophiocordyceps australis]